MIFAVFLRGVNVGGRRKFLPSVLAREMSKLDVVNLGAAGTFAVRRASSEKAVRREFGRRLAFETELLVCAGKEIVALSESDPFGFPEPKKGVRACVSILPNRPECLPRLPLDRPSGLWQVKLLGVRARFVFSLYRRRGKSILYPNAVVEQEFGLPATTRSWDTILALAGLFKP